MTISAQCEKGPLLYVAASRIPGRAANSFQVLKMAEALYAAVPGTVLMAQRGDVALPSMGKLQQHYGVTRIPPIRLLAAQGRFGIHVFNLQAALAAKRMKASLILTRSIGAAALAARLGIPTIWECHAPPQGNERYYWAVLSGASSFRRLVVISGALCRLMKERYPELSSQDILVAHDGVDIAHFSNILEPATAKAVAGRDPGRLVAAYAGHLYRGRGIDLIMACAKALPDWSFILAGGLPEDIARAELECRELGLRNVEFLGFVDNAELPARLAVADVLLMPYARRVMVSGGQLDTAQWMSPLKMFEYMAMGRAIVASDLPVLREVLDLQVASFAPPDDPAAWIVVLRRLHDPALRSRLGASAKQRVTRYDWTVRVHQMLDGIATLPGASA